MKFFIPLAIAAIGTMSAYAAPKAEVGKTLPAWSEGYLDIHAVNTGQGECSFMIFHDGTSMLVDAGECRSTTPNIVEPKPDSVTAPYLTYARYVKHFLKATGNKELDYMLLTHFHTDHMGELHRDTPRAECGAYRLTGIAGVGDIVPFRRVIDRGWPDYAEGVEPVSKAFPN